MTSREMMDALLGVGDDMATVATCEGWKRRIYEAYRVRVKTASLSSLLARMTKEGRLLRIDGFGPRGGYGYCRRLEHSDRVRRSVEERDPNYVPRRDPVFDYCSCGHSKENHSRSYGGCRGTGGGDPIGSSHGFCGCSWVPPTGCDNGCCNHPPCINHPG